MVHIPILRHGRPYVSMDVATLHHHATGKPLATVSQANSGLIVRDIHRTDPAVLERIPMSDLLAICARAAELFMTARLPLFETSQTPDDYLDQLSATTGMPITFCRANAEKIARVLREMAEVLAGLTRGLDLRILDHGYGMMDGRMMSFRRAGRIFGAVLPSNSPGVHALWIPAVALKAPVMLKPGREEPWTPFRVVQALIAAGAPHEAFGFYPTDHAGAGELLRRVDRGMVFGDANTTRPWRNDPRIEVHGPGFSKIILGPDVRDWRRHLDMMEMSIAANCGRSCINASGIWTVRDSGDIAEALARRLAGVQPLPAEDPSASIALFPNPTVAEAINTLIEHDLRIPGAEDVTARFRGGSRLVRRDRCAWLLPTIIHCRDHHHPLANREFLFPFASVVECPADKMPEALGPTLIATLIGADADLKARMMSAPNVDRLNLGPVPTCQIGWDQPHEGNLFDHLYRQRAFQLAPEPVAVGT